MRIAYVAIHVAPEIMPSGILFDPVRNLLNAQTRMWI